MRDPVDIRTKRGTSVIVIISRVVFAAYFVGALLIHHTSFFPESDVTLSWIIYLFALYLGMEYFYRVFGRRGIDLTFAFPLLLAIYLFHLASMVLDAQEKFPLMNRAEHFFSFVLVTYVVWVFFITYLPQNVWHQHPYYTALLVMSICAMLGVVNELIELILDRLFMSELIGYDPLDTTLDLLMNTLGSGLFLAVRLIVSSSDYPRSLKA